jgi:S1-C subfamily serine protease
VLGLVERCALRLAESREHPAFRELPPVAPPATRQFRAWFGSIPDYASETEGVKLAGVRAGSPAARAGLRAGDIVVRFGKHDIRSLDDYTIAISEAAPGDEVEVVVRRDGAALTLRAVLEAPRS